MSRHLARAQDAAPTVPLSLEECIARAMKKNFDLQIQAYSTDIAKENLIIAKTDFDPTINASVMGPPKVMSPMVPSRATKNVDGIACK